MARWDKLRKLKRNAEVVQFRAQNPDLSLAEIGEIFGISGPRVSEICKAEKRNKGMRGTQ